MSVAQSKILAAQPLPAGEAHPYFAARLRHETDSSDVWHDIQNDVKGFAVIDPRGPEAYAEAHIPGAVNMPHASIDKEAAAQLDPDVTYVVYGWNPGCNAGTKAAAKLTEHGISAKELIGGIQYWRSESLPVESSESS
ncbi:rhodanese-like domain-containing protein [Streptomyces sp. NBC_00459]|uniref:rhodanese-like domain-containing protein n=1 Tax=Streptomyces sp. NBC_00459 TaxID=2975749 RepID=UPI002E19F4FA